VKDPNMTMIRSFRNLLSRASGRTLTAAVAAASLYAFIDPSTYLYAFEVQRAKEAEVRGIAAKLGVDPEFLLHPEGVRHFDLHAAVAWANEKLGLAIAPQTNGQPLDVREALARVKSRYALVAADTALTKIAALVKLAGAPDAVRAKRKGGIRGEIESALRLLDRSLLPPLPDGASALAQARDRDARKAVDELRRQARGVINNPHALDDANLDATLRQLASTLSGTLAVKKTKPRWTKDPFPLKDAYRPAAVRPAGPTYGSNAVGSSAVGSNTAGPQTAAPALAPRANSVAADVAALGSSLKTPAKIFTWVHDRIEWESYSGVAKGALGTLKEARGNDWDQALLLRDLLTSQGFAAQLEWGKVTLPITRAMNLVGTEDPLQAANLLATAGVDGQVLTTAGKPTAVQMTHAWVRAFIPFLPNRGATLGTADTWVRMDPSFKRYDYQPGIAVAASWSEDAYLGAGILQAPVDHYADRLWSSIRANHLDCTNLGQIPKTGTIRAENFPFIPSTLTVHIDQLLGLAADPPTEQLQRVRLSLANEAGTIATTSLDLAETWGKKVTLTFPPATADDAAIIDSYGGLFNTPAYLVHLKPLVSIDDTAVAEGTPIAAGAALDLGLTFDQPNVASDAVHHDVVAGETHALVFDGGAVSDGLVATRAARLQTLAGAEPVLTEKLHLIGLRYMQRVDDGVRFAAGVRWHRAVKRTFEADVRRQIDVDYTIGGAPLRLAPAENNIDVARLIVGVVPISSDVSHRAEVLSLAGMESSYREGAIWEEMESQQGISAAKALLLARRAGQPLYTVDAANVDVVLGAATLADDVEEEIRGAIAQGRVAKLAPTPVALGHWSGTGYILEDPVTGAATYPISGGLAGGSDTGEATEGIKELLGSEPWLSGSPLGELLAQLLGLLGGGGNDDAPSTTQSDPVNLSSGNMYRSATDLSVVARGIPVALSRTYNSRSAVNGPFGYGWTFNYGETLTPNGDGSVVYREADGTEHLFTTSGGAFVSPAGKHLTLAATAGGWTLSFKDGMQFTFDSRGLLAAQSDLNGNTVTINRDAAGNITTVVDASGRTALTFTWTAGKITGVRDLGNRAVTYGYDGDDLVAVTDTLGKLWPMTYDLGHNLTMVADPLGHAQTYDYDADDRLMHHVDANGAEEFFHYDIAARQSVLTDRRGGDRLIVYDDLGRATMEADPAGNAVRASFDADNNRTSTTDSRGQTTAVEYDGQGNVTKQIAPDGGVTTTTYDALSRPLVSTDTIGTVTTNAYDGSGNLLTSSRTVNGVSETTTNKYDSRGQLLTTTDANNNVSSMTWNDNGTLATRTDAGQNTSTFTTDPLGRITSIKDPAQNETKLEYDAKDRIARMTDPYNNATSFAYDDAGRRTGVTTPRGTTTYTYDGEGRVLSVTDPLGHVTRTSYSAAGDVLARTDARGNVTRYEYDAIGRVTKMTDANGGV
jgi:YD repeat-containing protein